MPARRNLSHKRIEVRVVAKPRLACGLFGLSHLGIAPSAMCAGYVAHFACEQKLVFGHGNALAGTKAMMATVPGATDTDTAMARNAARMTEENSNGQCSVPCRLS